MHKGKYIFAQILEFIPRREFDQLIEKYNGNSRVRNLDCRDQFLAMVFGQLGNLKSLSGITASLNAHQPQLYHLGFKSKKFVLSTLTRANENRDWRIYRDLANLLIDRARKLYVDENNFTVELDGTPYAIDSTLIELCLSTFKWAKFYQGTSGIKVHIQLDLKANIPSFFLITKALVRDWDILDIIDFEVGAYYIMDRGYYDFARLCRIHLASAYFVIRAKKRKVAAFFRVLPNLPPSFWWTQKRKKCSSAWQLLRTSMSS